MYVCMYERMYECMYVCMYVCMEQDVTKKSLCYSGMQSLQLLYEHIT